MSPKEYPGVIIDGAVPHSEFERCEVVLEYACNLYLEQDRADAITIRINRAELDDETYGDIEDDIIDEINRLLPDDFVCTVGEAQPGDVIVREIDKDETDDDDPWGQMMGRNT